MILLMRTPEEEGADKWLVGCGILFMIVAFIIAFLLGA